MKRQQADGMLQRGSRKRGAVLVLLLCIVPVVVLGAAVVAESAGFVTDVAGRSLGRNRNNNNIDGGTRNSHSSTSSRSSSKRRCLCSLQASSSSSAAAALPPPARLRELLAMAEAPVPSQSPSSSSSSQILLLPCCYDGLSARAVARSRMFHATFLTGFGVSAVRGHPDTQLVSYGEMQQTCTVVAEALAGAALEAGDSHPLPCIAVRVSNEEQWWCARRVGCTHLVVLLLCFVEYSFSADGFLFYINNRLTYFTFYAYHTHIRTNTGTKNIKNRTETRGTGML
jgi:hypothetical protein